MGKMNPVPNMPVCKVGATSQHVGLAGVAKRFEFYQAAIGNGKARDDPGLSQEQVKRGTVPSLARS